MKQPKKKLPPQTVTIRRDVNGIIYCSGFSWEYPVGDHVYRLVEPKKATTKVGLLATVEITAGKSTPKKRRGR